MESIYNLLGYNNINNRLIYYYQTFSSLKTLSDLKLPNTYVYISSLHFGKDINDVNYLHLNNTDPDVQSDLWKDVEESSLSGINILVMLGGAGGAYTALFENETSFETYYKLLHDFLKKRPFIKGIDLDVEESVDLINIIRLISKLDQDFGKNFIITMAPIVSAMTSNSPGMGGFSYKTLLDTMEGRRLNWFNVQCYGSYNEEVYKNIIDNGYPPKKIVLGMLGDNYNKNSFPPILDEIKKIKTNYNEMGGVMIWEYGDTKINPIEWGKDISNLFHLGE